MACPNIRSEAWQKLVQKIGVFEAFREFVKNGEVIPNADNYAETFKGTNVTLKVFNALTNSKIQGFYDRFYKTNPEKFYSEIIPIAGKVQTDLLRDYNNRNNPQTLNDMISGILSEMSFTVETKQTRAEFMTYNDMEDYVIDSQRYLEAPEDYDEIPTKPEFPYTVINQDGKTIKGFNTLEEAEAYAVELNEKEEFVSNDAYSDMTVPGGINYRNLEIRTPDITPSITGHASFSTPQGIGWFRSDDKVIGGKYGTYHTIETPDELADIEPDSGTTETRGGIPTKTRRILEVQSDLFQKGRDKESLADSKKTSYGKELIVDGFKYEYFGSGDNATYQKVNLENKSVFYITKEEYDNAVGKQPKAANDFLQLLNKDNNWVTFFIKSIIQDSARRGYERVAFPGGDTASKIEGHQTLEGFITGRQEAISQIDKEMKEIGSKDTFIYDASWYSKRGNEYFESSPETGEVPINELLYEQARESRIRALLRERNQFEQEIQRAQGPEGMGAFSAIAKFYQNTVQNILKKQGYNPVEITDEYGNKWFEVQIQADRDKSTIFLQVGDKPQLIPSPASPATQKKIREFLDRIGVTVTGTDAIIYNNQKLNANGIAQPLEQLIQIVNGKEDIALSEEAMHMAVEFIQQKNPSLFKSMMDRVGNYNLYQNVFSEYKNYPLYQTKEGRPDVPKIKKEAIGKILAQTVINLNEGTNEKPELLVQTRTWWQKIVDFLKALFLRAQMNPFEQAAAQVLSGTGSGTVESTETPFIQAGAGMLFDKLTDINNNTARTGPDSYEVNGQAVKRTIMTDVLEHYKKKLGGRADEFFNDFKRENQTKLKIDIKDILDRYIDDDGIMRANPEPHVNPSAVDPYNNTIYNTLESHLKDRLNTYPPGTRFSKGVNIYNGRNTAGTVDLIAVLPNDQVDILQFKAPDLSGRATDIAKYRQEGYNIEIESIRKILQDNYGVSRSQFRQTRALPIRTFYSNAGPGTPYNILDSITVGDVNVELIQDDILLPVPSISEGTGNEKFDKLIRRLRGLARKLADERVSPEKRFEKSQRVTALFAAIRKLQIQGKAEGVISSANTIIKRQKELYTQLKDKIDQIDPAQATIEELNKVAADILDEKDQIEVYKDLYRVFKEVYTDGSPESQEYLRDTKEIAEDAQDALDQYYRLAEDFRKTKFSQKVGIADAMNPEKQLTWYRRMVRSLSQSQTKAGAILWKLVERINNLHQTQFRDRLFKLYELEGRVDKWLQGKSLQELYHKIFQFDGKNRWNGRIIPKYSAQFYKDLEKAQSSRDMKWVNDNIDVDAYNAWFLKEHQDRVDDSKTSRVHADDAENARIIQENLQKFVDTYYIGNSKGISEGNNKLRNFPKDKWFSDQYKELLKSENEPILQLYNYWQDRIKESFEEGMLQEGTGRTWFPNVRREWLEKMSSAKAGGKLKSVFNFARVEAEDIAFGKIDPLTGKPVDEVHAAFISDLGEWVKDTDDSYFLDYSEKSMDIFKVIALWDQEIVKFKLKSESEALARLLYYTEAHPDRQALETNRAGSIKRDRDGHLILVSNEINAKYIKEHIDAVYYGKRLATESDINIRVPYAKAVNGINKLFGREVISPPEQEYINMSGMKAIEAMNRFFVAKTLGLNLFTATAQWFGGTANTFINQGRFFDKKDLLEAELQYTSARFWATEENKKTAGLLSYVHPYTEDRTEQAIRGLSVSGMVRYLSSDHLFYLQRGSDNWVNRVIAMAIFKNTMVRDGKLVNIREYAKKELGHAGKYSQGYEESVKFQKRLENRIDELKKSPEALINVAQIVNDRIVIPGIDRDSQTLVEFRQSILEVIKDALGNTSREDLSLYKRQIMWQSFFMFKNWIPRMADVRFQSFKYNPGTNQYEYGRARMLWNAVHHLGMSNVTSLLRKMKGDNSKLVEVAKEEYERKRQKAQEQEQEFDIDEAEFIDMYIKGVNAEVKELLLALVLMGILIAARLQAPDRDDDPETKGAYRWMLRGLDKLTDEVNFFYNPASFTDIVNGSVFPSVSLLVDIQKFLTTSIMKGFYYSIGDDEAAEKQKASKYLFRLFPITKELITYIAVFNDDLAKEFGIRMSSQHGNMR